MTASQGEDCPDWIFPIPSSVPLLNLWKHQIYPMKKTQIALLCEDSLRTNSWVESVMEIFFSLERVPSSVWDLDLLAKEESFCGLQGICPQQIRDDQKLYE